jgi:hypothetical protein
MRRLLLASLLGLAACVPLADHPAGDEATAVFDARLQGAWRAGGGDAPFFVFVGPADETGRGIRLLTLEATRDGRWKQDEYEGITTRRGGHGLLSVRYATSGGERHGWALARYTLAGSGRLQVATLDERRLAALVRAGKVPGRVSGDGPYADVDLTMGRADLVALLESRAAQRLFGAPRALVRVASTKTSARRGHQSTGAGVAPIVGR